MAEISLEALSQLDDIYKYVKALPLKNGERLSEESHRIIRFMFEGIDLKYRSWCVNMLRVMCFAKPNELRKDS